VTSPFQGQFVIHRLELAVIKLHTKSEVSTFTHYEDMKGNAKSKCINWGGLGIGGPKVTGIITIR